MDLQTYIPIWLVVCPLVLLGGIIDAVAGGGGLITLPSYLIAGLSPHQAVATNKCGNVFGTFLAMVKFLKQGYYHRACAVVSMVTALIGAFLGARLNMLVPAEALYYIMLALVPVLAVFLVVKRDFGTVSHIDRFSERGLVLVAGAVGLVMGGYDGFFGPGAGTFLMLAFAGICGFDLMTASGNTKVVNTASNFASLVTFAMAGEVVWMVGIPAAAFGMIGGHIGSSLALKNGAKIIRPMFFVVLAILVGKLAIDLLA